jgi:membrane protein required for colicin V production
MNNHTLDFIVIAVMLLSAGFAYMRGFVREVLAVVAWVGAALITYYGYGYVTPFITFLPPPFNGIAAGATVFIVALIILSIITNTIAGRVHQTGMSSIDRLFGLLFGLVRGTILVSLGYIALLWYLGPKPLPQWVTGARSSWFLAKGADEIRSLMPPEWVNQVAPTKAATRQSTSNEQGDADAAARALESPKASAKPYNPAPVYGPAERAGMDRLSSEIQ